MSCNNIKNEQIRLTCPKCGTPMISLTMQFTTEGDICYVCTNCGHIWNLTNDNDDEKLLASFLILCLMTKNKKQDMTKNKKQDMVNHPNHYCKPGKMECRELQEIVAKTLDLPPEASCHLGPVIKYIYRYKDKHNPIEDLDKAEVYFKFMIDALKKHVQ